MEVRRVQDISLRHRTSNERPKATAFDVLEFSSELRSRHFCNLASLDASPNHEPVTDPSRPLIGRSALPAAWRSASLGR